METVFCFRRAIKHIFFSFFLSVRFICSGKRSCDTLCSAAHFIKESLEILFIALILLKVSLSATNTRSCGRIDGVLIAHNCLDVVYGRHVAAYRLLNLASIDVRWILLCFLYLVTLYKFIPHWSNAKSCLNCTLFCTDFKILCFASFAGILFFIIKICNWVFVIAWIVILIFSSMILYLRWWSIFHTVELQVFIFFSIPASKVRNVMTVTFDLYLFLISN